MRPSVDVVIAAHNEAALIGTCLDALQRQDYPSELVRLFVADDRSTDATAAIAAAAGCTVLASGSRGPAAARNAGIRAGQAPLVGFLDAHAIPAANWISALARSFQDARVGGCQARVVSRASDPRVDRFVRESPLYSDAGIVEQTVAGTRTLYPWILSGNCMYRRSALDDVGLFDERLAACEDVDLGWRVVLAGYLLTTTSDTEAVHVERRPWKRFITKGWTYGRGAAQVARAYALHGARSSLSPRCRVGRRIEETVSGFCYWAGYRFEQRRPRAAVAPRKVSAVRRWRNPFTWTPRVVLAVAPTAVYWVRGDTISVIVEVSRRQRIVLEGAGDFIWRLLTIGAARETVVDQLIDTYGIGRRTAEPDVDEMIDELVDLGIVTRIQTSLGP